MGGRLKTRGDARNVADRYGLTRSTAKGSADVVSKETFGLQRDLLTLMGIWSLKGI